VPPPALQVQSLMDEYFALYEQKRETVHPVVLSAELHERLVTIHPFTDGNGRTARLVMNLVLLQHGFPLAIIGGGAESRIAYYDALEQAQMVGDNEGFVMLIAKYVKAGLERYIGILA
jgi:Fic family protein